MTAGQTARHLEKEREWRSKITECRSSGVGVKKWCDEHQISPKTFYKWDREIRAKDNAAEPTEFVELAISTDQNKEPEKSVVATVRIGGIEIDVYDGANMKELSYLLREMDHA